MAILTAPAAGQTVRLRTVATVGDEAVRLADVAELTGVAASAGQVELARLSAAAGTTVEVRQVQAALLAAGVNVAPIRFAGASRCEVRRVASARPAAPVEKVESPAPPSAPVESIAATQPAEPPAMTLGDRVRQALAEQLGVAVEAVTVEFDRASSRAAALEVEGDVSITSTDRACLGRRHWRADTVIGNRKYRHYLNGTASVCRPTVVLVRDLPAGQTIAVADVRLEDRADDGSADVMGSLELVIGQQTERSLRAGQAVSTDDLSRPVLIGRNQMAVVTSRVGGLSVQLRAKALSAGRRGELVQFERGDDRSALWAVVTGPGRAEVAADREAVK